MGVGRCSWERRTSHRRSYHGDPLDDLRGGALLHPRRSLRHSGKRACQSLAADRCCDSVGRGGGCQPCLGGDIRNGGRPGRPARLSLDGQDQRSDLEVAPSGRRVDRDIRVARHEASENRVSHLAWAWGSDRERGGRRRPATPAACTHRRTRLGGDRCRAPVGHPQSRRTRRQRASAPPDAVSRRDPLARGRDHRTQRSAQVERRRRADCDRLPRRRPSMSSRGT